MKKLFLLGLLLLPCLLQAQINASSKPNYLRFPEVPPFAMTAAGGKVVTNKDLKRNKPTMIFLFSVDCEHCQHETKNITDNIKKFKGTQIVMITPFHYDEMMAFYKGYGIQRYPDIITMGTDSTRRLPMFYRQRSYPGIYIYNKKNQIVYHHEGTTPIDTLVHYLKMD